MWQLCGAARRCCACLLARSYFVVLPSKSFRLQDTLWGGICSWSIPAGDHLEIFLDVLLLHKVAMPVSMSAFI